MWCTQSPFESLSRVWPGVCLQNEGMTPIVSQWPVVSRITLALMEDTGQVKR